MLINLFCLRYNLKFSDKTVQYKLCNYRKEPAMNINFISILRFRRLETVYQSYSDAFYSNILNQRKQNKLGLRKSEILLDEPQRKLS